MNTKQLKVIEQLKTATLNRTHLGEIKREEVRSITDDIVALILEVGYKGDEGTAAIIMRRSFIFFVGPRGGLKAYGKTGARLVGWRQIWRQ